MKIAVICASGIGDALLFQTVSHLLQQEGHEVITHSAHLASFGSWLPQGRLAPQPPLEQMYTFFQSYDALFLQHDNSPKAFCIQALQKPLYTFYSAHLTKKHGPLRDSWDYVCDPQKTMVENIALATRKFFGKKAYENGLTPPKGLVHRKHKLQIAIHPTSSSPDKTWEKEKFLSLAERLQREGYEPIFLTSPSERHLWNAPLLTNLGDLATFLYESGTFLGNDSGPAHLASYLQIPHLVIGGNGHQMPLWRTGWFPGKLILPPQWLMRFKWPRLHWSKFIGVNKIIKNLKSSVLSD
ncbi:MAG: hypothetical protein HY861_00435 [Chlamydiia bacterium]|nr:hypothetical protein [Chlamydiia bacterium]